LADSLDVKDIDGQIVNFVITMKEQGKGKQAIANIALDDKAQADAQAPQS
jgi:hypothetical protein